MLVVSIFSIKYPEFAESLEKFRAAQTARVLNGELHFRFPDRP